MRQSTHNLKMHFPKALEVQSCSGKQVIITQKTNKVTNYNMNWPIITLLSV